MPVSLWSSFLEPPACHRRLHNIAAKMLATSVWKPMKSCEVQMKMWRMRCGHENRVLHSLHSHAQSTVEQQEQQVHGLAPDSSGQVNQRCLIDRLANGEIAALWLGLDCRTWSRARRGKRSKEKTEKKRGGWPCALRGDTHETIYGLNDLKPQDMKRVEAGWSSTK